MESFWNQNFGITLPNTSITENQFSATLKPTTHQPNKVCVLVFLSYWLYLQDICLLLSHRPTFMMNCTLTIFYPIEIDLSSQITQQRMKREETNKTQLSTGWLVEAEWKSYNSLPLLSSICAHCKVSVGFVARHPPKRYNNNDTTLISILYLFFFHFTLFCICCETKTSNPIAIQHNIWSEWKKRGKVSKGKWWKLKMKRSLKRKKNLSFHQS